MMLPEPQTSDKAASSPIFHFTGGNAWSMDDVIGKTGVHEIAHFAAAVLILMSSCSYRSDRAPAPAATAADLLVNSGEWLTISGTLLRPDSTELQISAGNPFLKTLLLYNVTFYRNGTAVDTNDPNGLTANGLTWKLTGRHLLVRINDNNTDKVDALILELSPSKLVLRVSDYYDYQGTTYTGLIQTFGH